MKHAFCTPTAQQKTFRQRRRPSIGLDAFNLITPRGVPPGVTRPVLLSSPAPFNDPSAGIVSKHESKTRATPPDRPDVWLAFARLEAQAPRLFFAGYNGANKSIAVFAKPGSQAFFSARRAPGVGLPASLSRNTCSGLCKQEKRAKR